MSKLLNKFRSITPGLDGAYALDTALDALERENHPHLLISKIPSSILEKALKDRKEISKSTGDGLWVRKADCIGFLVEISTKRECTHILCGYNKSTRKYVKCSQKKFRLASHEEVGDPTYRPITALNVVFSEVLRGKSWYAFEAKIVYYVETNEVEKYHWHFDGSSKIQYLRNTNSRNDKITGRVIKKTEILQEAVKKFVEAEGDHDEET